MFNKICIGSVQFGLKYGLIKRHKASYKQVNKILQNAYKNKINYIDTASNYGDSETKISKYLKNKPKEKWNIITKINKDQTLLKKYEKSKEMFGRNLFCILAHNATIFKSKNFQKHYLILKKRKVKIKVGVSVYDKSEILQVIKCKNKPSIIQIPINILDTRLYKSGIFRVLKKLKIKIHARSIFLQGLFFLKDSLIFKKFPDLKLSVINLRKIAKKNKLNLPELSMNWVYSLPEISKVIIGINDSTQLNRNLLSLKKKLLKKNINKVLKINYSNQNVLNPQNWK